MDPVGIKFAQLVFAELLGAGLTGFGIYLFLRGVSGKSNLILKGAGMTAKLTNSAPGGVVLIVGLVIVWLSLQGHVDRTVTDQGANQSTSLQEQWLSHSYSVTQVMDAIAISETIVGKGPNVRFVTRMEKLDKDDTLSAVASRVYGDQKYWHLLAAINKDRGYFTLATAKPESKVAKGQYLQIWSPSKYDGTSYQERVQVSGADRRTAYDEMLGMARSGVDFDSHVDGLIELYRRKELDLALTPANIQGVSNLRELSLKYYGDGKYWPIIVWANKAAFGVRPQETDALPSGTDLMVPQFLGWPR